MRLESAEQIKARQLSLSTFVSKSMCGAFLWLHLRRTDGCVNIFKSVSKSKSLVFLLRWDKSFSGCLITSAAEFTEVFMSLVVSPNSILGLFLI